jgi:hypothetical protein
MFHSSTLDGSYAKALCCILFWIEKGELRKNKQNFSVEEDKPNPSRALGKKILKFFGLFFFSLREPLFENIYT